VTAALPTLFPPGEWGLSRVSAHWFRTHAADPVGLALFERHYSAHRYRDGRVGRQFGPPGEKTTLITAEGDAVWLWHNALRPRLDGQQGVMCSLFRNEGNVRSSLLIREAMDVAWVRWPGARLFTYVDAGKVRSANPGCCFKKAGWRRCGVSASGKIRLEACPAAFGSGRPFAPEDVSVHRRTP
jgi:hypothetical protein